MSTIRGDESVKICPKCGNEQTAMGLAVRCVRCGERLLPEAAEARPPQARQLGGVAAGLGWDALFGRLTVALQWIFAAWVVFAGVGIAFRAIERSLLSRAAENRFSVSTAEALASDHRVDTFGYVAIAAFVVTGIVFIIWFHRAYRRTRALGGDMRYSDGWAIGAWFIPIGNLWIPKKLANDIWWGTERPENRQWAEHSAVLSAWWVTWVLSWVTVRFVGTNDLNNVDDGLRANLASIVVLGFVLLSAAFAFFVVRQIGQRLAARTAAVTTLLAAEPSPPPTTATPHTDVAPDDAFASGRPEPWRLVAATVMVVALLVGTVIVVTGTSGSRTHRASKPIGTAPAVIAAPAPPDFDRHESHSDGFAISVPSSWTSVDLTAPGIDATLEQLRLTDPGITDYLDQQDADAGLSFYAVDTSTQTQVPAQVSVQRLPTEGQSLNAGARQAQEIVTGSAGLVGTVDRKKVELPAGPAQVLSLKFHTKTPAGDRIVTKSIYMLVSGDSAYVIALGGSDDQSQANASTFAAIIRSAELVPKSPPATSPDTIPAIPPFPKSFAPDYITAGPDGNLWFTNRDSNEIGRITPAGEITVFPDPDGKIKGLEDITAGPDGNLWFTSYELDGDDQPRASLLGRITPTGEITTFENPKITEPDGITAGPDGNLWFTNYSSDRIGRITPDGQVTLLGNPDHEIKGPDNIVSGPDGNLWFTNYDDGTIGRITPNGDVTVYSDPDQRIKGLEDIAAGPDGNLWFTAYELDDNDNPTHSRIGRITQNGEVTVFADPTKRITEPEGITPGPDGNLWFTSYELDDNDNPAHSRIGRITPDGKITVVEAPSDRVSGPEDMTYGPDGNLWFTDTGNDTIGRIAPNGEVTTFPVM